MAKTTLEVRQVPINTKVGAINTLLQHEHAQTEYVKCRRR